MSQGMLGNLPLAEVQRARDDLERKLAGPNGQAWFSNLKRFLCKEKTWRDSTFFTYDKARDSLTFLEDVGFVPGLKNVSDLELVTFLRKGETGVAGEEMVRRAKEELGANLGQRHAEWLLERHDEIPGEMRKFYLVFPGTVWWGAGGRRCVPCLSWCVGRWDLFFSRIGSDYWGGLGRLFRPRVSA